MNDYLSIEINGLAYSGFKTATASTSIEEASGTFSFTVSALNNLASFPIRAGYSCRILANGIPIINGYVEKIRVNYDAISEHTIVIEGRDKTCDIIDSTLGEGMTFNSGVTIIDVANKVFNYLGITDIKAYTNDSDIQPFNKGEIISSETGETAFDFISKYALQRQLLVTTDGNGNLLFARTATKNNLLKTTLDSRINAQPTILSAEIDIDNTKRFYKYILNTQTSLSGTTTVAEIYDIVPAKVINNQSIAYDEKSRKTRILNLMQSEQSYAETKNLQNRATYEANFRKSRAFNYSPTIQGFTPINDQGIIWRPNLLVNVYDEFCNIIDDQLLIQKVDYIYNLDEGARTKITLVNKSSYTVDVLQGIKYKNRSKAHKEGNDLVAEIFNFRG